MFSLIMKSLIKGILKYLFYYFLRLKARSCYQYVDFKVVTNQIVCVDDANVSLPRLILALHN